MGDDVKDIVREKYAAAAARVENRTGSASGGCGCGCGPEGGGDAITRDLYGPEDSEGLPEDALAASLGCGNPTALTELHPGRDRARPGLRGRDRRAALGPSRGAGRESLRARHDGRDAGAGTPEPAGMEIDNAEFLKGEIEAVPLPDASVDVVISNCVVNLSGDKAPDAPGGVQGPAARRQARDLRRRGARRRSGGSPPQHGAVGGMRGRRSGGVRVPWPAIGRRVRRRERSSRRVCTRWRTRGRSSRTRGSTPTGWRRRSRTGSWPRSSGPGSRSPDEVRHPVGRARQPPRPGGGAR